MAYTKGPWTVWTLAPDSDPAQRPIVTTANGETEVCGICNNHDDAHLIAAAPDLLELLLDIQSARRVEQDIAQSRIVAVIEKAMGR